MKRIITILLTCLILLTPKTLAYWDAQVNVEPIEAKSRIQIASFPFIDFDTFPDYDKTKQYKQFDLVHLNGHYYVITRIEACSYEQKCPDPSTITNPYYTPYKEVTLQWQAYTLYEEGAIVMDEGKLYRVFESGNATTTRPKDGARSWLPLDGIVYNPRYPVLENSYVLEGKQIHLINTTLEPNYTSIPNWAIEKSYSKAYNAKTKYKEKEAVFFESGIYVVKDVTLANESTPGSRYGAWQRIDTNDYYDFNIYKQGDVVRYQGLVYQAVTDNPTSAPETDTYTWNRLGEVHYQAFNTYDVNDVVLYNKRSYRSLQRNSGIAPDSDSSVWTIQQ